MAWLGDKLSQFSNITDQISTFTKEVLTETTEEVADPGAELQVAKKKISDLEAINEHMKTEFDKLKAHSEELNENLETSECQISAISQEYRKLLQEKEAELKDCKTEIERLRQSHKQPNSASSPLTDLANETFFPNGGEFDTVDLGAPETEWAGGFHDFSDVVASQEIINRLQREQAKISKECERWKAEATSLKGSSDDVWKMKCTDLEAQLAQTKVKESELTSVNKQLQSDLQTLVSEKDSLQMRLAETISKLKFENANEVGRLDKEKGLLETQLGELQSSITHHQSTISKLQQEHSSSLSQIAKLQSTITDLETQVASKEAKIQTLRLEKDSFVSENKVNSENENALDELRALQQELAAKTSEHVEEKQILEQKLVGLEERITELSRQLSDRETVVKQLKSQLAHSGEMRTSNEALTKQLEKKSEECDKYTKQLTQLRKHLLEVEERYTQEAVKADQTENSLKQDLSALREQLLESSSHDNQATRELQEQLSEAQDQLQSMIEERDSALLQMSNAQEQAHQNATALSNLQTVLEQFQRDQSSELAQALKRSQTELADSLAQNEQLQRQLGMLGQQQLALDSLREENQRKTSTIEQLEKQIGEVTAALEAEKEHRVKLTSDSTERFDRDLVKNLVLGFVHAPEAKKPEVLTLIGKMLDFSEEELSEALKGRGRGRGSWLWGLWGSGQSSQQQKESLSQLFVKFLESESAPKSAPPSSTAPHSIPGYVDSRTDPDRPSLATASLVPHPIAPRLPNNTEHSVQTEKQAQKQSSILSSVLNS